MADFDLVIRGGTVIDGTGRDPFAADIAVSGGRIAGIGRGLARGAREIAAKGLIVTPGFIDIHTHYDGQATWDGRLTPSSQHGVTTAVMGNCGVGFAPCRRADQTRLVRLMEGVEDIPEPVLMEGLPWTWETFKDYLDVLEARPHDIDFAAQVPHAALRVYVMGERGADRAPATQDEIRQMACLARDAVSDGAIGFSTSRTLNHQTSEGKPTPTLTAAGEELIGIAMGLKEAGRGVLQVVTDFLQGAEEFAMLREMVARSGRPLSISVAATDKAPEGWRRVLEAIEGWNAEGLPVKAQVAPRPIGILLGLELTLNPFTAHPSYRAIAKEPLERRLTIMRDPSFRARILSEEPSSDFPFMQTVLRTFDKIFDLGDPPNYEPPPEASIGARAAREGSSAFALAYDLLIEGDGRRMLYSPFINYPGKTLDHVREMLLSPVTLFGLGDGGAHVGTICDGSFPTTLLVHWTRDRTAGPKLALPFIIEKQTRANARAMGLFDRGVLAPGMKADINVIDHGRLRLHPPEVRYDLPAGGRRLLQRADGYVATIVSGKIIAEDGAPTGEMPGRLVRGVAGAAG